MELKICMLLPGSNLSIPLRPALMGVYKKYFAKRGHTIIAIIHSLKNKGTKKKYWGDVEICEISISTSPLYWLYSYIKKFIFIEKTIEGRNCNILFVRNSIFDGLFGIYIKRKYNIPLVFQYSFPIIELSKERGGLFRIIGIIQEFLYLKIMKEADVIHPITKWMLKNQNYKSIDTSKIIPLPDGVSPDVFHPNVPTEDIYKEYDIKYSPTLIYIGTMDKLRKLDMLFYSFLKTKIKIKNAKLLMVGEGNDKDNLEKLAHKLGLREDVIFTGKVPYSKIPSFIAASDIGISMIQPIEIYKISSPIKLYEYMGVGKPVVANMGIIEQEDAIKESRGGILVSYNADAFANAIIELLENPKKAKKMGKKSREWVVKNRSYENMAQEIEKEYYKLLKSYNKET